LVKKKLGHFASALVSLLLRKISVSTGYKEFYSKEPLPEDIDLYLKAILKELFKELNLVKNLLMYSPEEIDRAIRDQCEKYAINIPVRRLLPGATVHDLLNQPPIIQ